MQKKSERLFRIFNRLKTKPHTVEELHRWCQSHDIPAGPRTIYRYLTEIQSLAVENGFKVVSNESELREKKWHVEPDADAKRNRLDEAIIGFQLLSRLSGQHVRSIGSEYIDKLSLQIQQSLDSSGLGPAIFNHMVLTGWGEAEYQEKDRRLLKEIIQAIDKKTVVKVRLLQQLQAEDPQPESALYHLHCLVSHRGSLFITATKSDARELLFLDFESILKLIPTDKHFKKQFTHEQVMGMLNKRFGITYSKGPQHHIKLAFHPSDKSGSNGFHNPFIQKRKWHSTQRFHLDKNGLLIMEFESTLNRELIGWIMMWLDHIQVLGPPELKKLIDQKLDLMKENLKGKRPYFSTPGDF
ncbi:MAG: helix-turn-helix transcriptional regulator [Bacteroidota bacterium]|jgi:predicted DNA-binding transcriptional regulator YafY